MNNEFLPTEKNVLHIKDKLNFDRIDLTQPNEVIEEIASQVTIETNGMVTGCVKPYEGPLVSQGQNAVAGIGAVLRAAMDPGGIQKTLGRQGEEIRSYEFFLNTPVYESYKYRVCYFQFGVAHYPVTVVMEQDVADALTMKRNSAFEFCCENREELEDLISKAIGSHRVIEVIQELIRVNQIMG